MCVTAGGLSPEGYFLFGIRSRTPFGDLGPRNTGRETLGVPLRGADGPPRRPSILGRPFLGSPPRLGEISGLKMAVGVPPWGQASGAVAG